ncbi:MlaE family lipid ABC transporter permease subunit [Tumidithrix helvetica PCC 7403]|uniref:MlaE family lipid ABC transporter permease subunit n=1 Tax=Tumidithrix helvetica TaxID=3457545 RepID=UPI003CABD19C
MGNLGAWSIKIVQSFLLLGQIIVHVLFRRRIHWRNTKEQMSAVGTESVMITLVTASFVGGVFTIQVAREFIHFGAQQAIGGILAIALCRELAPVLTAVIIAGRVGSAFAAEIGTMQVTEQIDALYMLRTDPIDYLATPRLIACVLMLPILTILGLLTGMTGGMLISQAMYGIPYSMFLDSVKNFLQTWDLIAAMLKSCAFGALIAVIGTSWGLTTTGGAKGVGESTTTAVVTALLAIFISNFFLSWLFFNGASSTIVR